CSRLVAIVAAISKVGSPAALCPLSRLRERQPPTEDDRAWWLRHFTDAEIAQMTLAIFGTGSVGNVRGWRERRLGAANGRAGHLRRRRRPRPGRPRRQSVARSAYRARAEVAFVRNQTRKRRRRLRAVREPSTLP